MNPTTLALLAGGSAAFLTWAWLSKAAEMDDRRNERRRKRAER